MPNREPKVGYEPYGVLREWRPASVDAVLQV
jgi:hypothetical protein